LLILVSDILIWSHDCSRVSRRDSIRPPQYLVSIVSECLSFSLSFIFKYYLKVSFFYKAISIWIMNLFLKTFSLVMPWAILNQKSKMIYLEGMSMSVRNMVLKKSNLIYHHHSIVQKMMSLSVPLKDLFQ
jgi:hypothetical protein